VFRFFARIVSLLSSKSLCLLPAYQKTQPATRAKTDEQRACQGYRCASRRQRIARLPQ
jgi:hypothetical protein